MKSIEVSAAILVHNNLIFLTQRGYGEFKDKWEFPGGKLEMGETPEACLVREIHEELNAKIQILSFLKTVEYDYSSFHLTMHCFLCSLEKDHYDLLEHEAAKWVPWQELGSFDLLPADQEVLNEIESFFLKRD
ncbi:MAG: (deoxy)nucleoside triphosphate pyrophosphohydrolase [Candidatus Enteromonas sp.]